MQNDSCYSLCNIGFLNHFVTVSSNTENPKNVNFYTWDFSYRYSKILFAYMIFDFYSVPLTQY